MSETLRAVGEKVLQHHPCAQEHFQFLLRQDFVRALRMVRNWINKGFARGEVSETDRDGDLQVLDGLERCATATAAE